MLIREAGEINQCSALDHYQYGHQNTRMSQKGKANRMRTGCEALSSADAITEVLITRSILVPLDL